jgi:hypothetical protein
MIYLLFAWRPSVTYILLVIQLFLKCGTYSIHFSVALRFLFNFPAIICLTALKTADWMLEWKVSCQLREVSDGHMECLLFISAMRVILWNYLQNSFMQSQPLVTPWQRASLDRSSHRSDSAILQFPQFHSKSLSSISNRYNGPQIVLH